MRDFKTCLLCAIVGSIFGGLIVYVTLQSTEIMKYESDILKVCFSPNGGCEQEILHWINQANETIDAMVYSFTLDTIGNALVDAHYRNVSVRVVFEKSQISQYSEYHKLDLAGVQVHNDTNSNLMHNKVMIVDGYIVLTGSYNWSKNAENYNNENLVVINSTRIADEYKTEFEYIWGP